MNKKMKIHSKVKRLLKLPFIKQKSKEWYSFKKKVVSSSQAATILDCNPYNNKRSLLINKCNNNEHSNNNTTNNNLSNSAKFNSANTDNDGKLSYNELSAANNNFSQTMSQQDFNVMTRLLGDEGYLNKDNFMQMIKISLSPPGVNKEVFKMFNNNNDGKLNYDEFSKGIELAQLKDPTVQNVTPEQWIQRAQSLGHNNGNIPINKILSQS